MNKHGRKQLDEARAKIEEAKTIVETLAEEEREKFDNMPEGLQGSERGQAFETNAETLDQAQGALCEAADELENIE